MRSQKERVVFTLVWLLLAGLRAASAQEVLWSRNHGGIWPDGAHAIEYTADGGYITAGFTGSFATSGPYDVYLVKTDADGNALWSRVFGGVFNLSEMGAAVRQVPDGGYVVAGRLEVNPQTFDSLLIRTDAAGNLLWQRTYDPGLGEDDRAHAVWVTSDGGFILAGQAWFGDIVFGSYDMYVVKTNADGYVEWWRTYEYDDLVGVGADIAFSVIEVSGGGYLIAGYTQSSVWDGWVVRTDAVGNVLWQRTYGGAGSDALTSAQEVASGGFVFAGMRAAPAGDTDLWLIRTDGSGNPLWTRTFGSSGGFMAEDQGRCVREMPDGGFVVAGHTSSFGAGSWDWYVLRTDSEGNEVWTVVYGGESDDRAFSVVPSPGGVVAAGWAYSFGSGWGDVHLVRLYDGLAGDLDGDGDVDLSDFVTFQLCFGGSNNPPAPTCPPGVDADLDGDGDVDLADFLIFQQNFTGSL